MGGGILQLAAYGAQDVYLTGDPQITFWKVVYRRYTNFAMESIEQQFDSDIDFGKSKLVCTLAKSGDLIHKIWLQVTINRSVDDDDEHEWIDWLGFLLVKSVEIEIGGTKIDKHYGEWLHFMWNYTLSGDKTEEAKTDLIQGEAGNDEITLFIPLQFWFCRNAGLAIPILALQYHDIKLNLELREKSELETNGYTLNNITGNFWVDYVYLDTDERRRFAQISHEYLIEQVQSINVQSSSIMNSTSTQSNHTQKLILNHPVKEIIWTLSKETETTNDFDQFFNYGGSTSYMKSARITLNGNDRIRDRNEKYFRLVQPFQHHTSCANQGNTFMYSFALKPEEHQPSGTCNFSRIENAELKLEYESTSTLVLKVYAWSYNVLRITAGMAGLAFAN